MNEATKQMGALSPWRKPAALVAHGVLAASALVGCGGGGGDGTGSSPSPVAAASNRAQFVFDCDLNGVVGVLTMDVEIITNVGLTYGPGPSPSISGVISAGSNTILTSGKLESPTASYVFSGRDNFADFTQLQPITSRFLVQWSSTPTGISLTANPFGPGPTTQDCRSRSSTYL